MKKGRVFSALALAAALTTGAVWQGVAAGTDAVAPQAVTAYTVATLITLRRFISSMSVRTREIRLRIIARLCSSMPPMPPS